MSDINVAGPEGEKGDEFVEVEEWKINPEDDLIDSLERRIKDLNIQNEDAIKRAEELNQRLELAREALELQKTQEKESFIAKLRLAIVLLLSVVLFFAVMSVSAPDLLERMFRNSFTLPALGLSLILALSVLLLPRQRRSLDDTFLEIDRAFSRKSELGGSPKGNIVNVVVNGSSDQIRPKASDQDEQENFPKQILGSSSDFEFCISEIVDYLGDHIKLAESKASKLLDKGTTYLRRGLYFYIGSIVVWQIWGILYRLMV